MQTLEFFDTIPIVLPDYLGYNNFYDMIAGEMTYQ